MTYTTTVYLSDEQKIWINEMSLNVSKYVRSLIDKDMEKWKQITDQVVTPIIQTEKELEEMMVIASEENEKRGVIINQPE